LQEEGNVSRIVLQVGVQQDEDVAARMIDAGGDGGRLAEIAAQDHHAHMLGVLASQPLENLHAAVLAAIIHEDHFPGMRQGIEGGVQGIEQERQVIHLIKDRDDDRKCVHFR
jgi:hypothetical protein